MKALEFETKLEIGDSLRVPENLAAQIPKEEAVRVIVLVPENDEDAAWRELAQREFLRGYSESDSIYDAI